MAEPDQPFGDLFDPQFMVRLRRQLCRVTCRFPGVRLELEELFQEVLTRLLESPPDRRGRGDDPYREHVLALASTIAYQRIIDTSRRKCPLANSELIVTASGGAKWSVGEDSADSIWGAVCRAVEGMPDPPPQAFVRAWCNLRQSDVVVTEVHVTQWQREFQRTRSTILRWLKELKAVILDRVVHCEREAPP